MNPIDNPTDIPGDNSEPKKPNSKYKTQLCRHFMKLGRCNFGDKCQFAHGQEELKIIPGMNINPQPYIPKRMPSDAMRDNHKTELCKYFSNDGHCRYGSGCNYAHGQAELRPKGMNMQGPNMMNPMAMGMGMNYPMNMGMGMYPNGNFMMNPMAMNMGMNMGGMPQMNMGGQPENQQQFLNQFMGMNLNIQAEEKKGEKGNDSKASEDKKEENDEPK